MKIILITNIPAPYRVSLFDEIAKSTYVDFTVLYCNRIESNRKWKIPKLHHKHIYLYNKNLKIKNKNIYFNIDIWSQLMHLNPDIIITTGFYPTMLMAIAYTKLHKKQHIVFTDGWALTDKNLSILHRIFRKIFYRRAKSVITISEKGKSNVLSYGVPDHNIFICPITINNDIYSKTSDSKRIYDLMFSGQLITRKMPLFFCNVAIMLKKIIKNIKVLIIGSGPLEKEMLTLLEDNDIDYDFPGFVEQNELPDYYAKSKLLLFPTLLDHWGVVANEACAAGTPVVTCENAGVANELIIHNLNGLILPLMEDVWVNEISKLIQEDSRLKKMSNNCIKKTQENSLIKSSEIFLHTMENVYKSKS